MFEKLRKKIINDTGIELVDFRRTYASREMMASGGYSWVDTHKEWRFDVGSINSAEELLKRHKVYLLMNHEESNWQII